MKLLREGFIGGLLLELVSKRPPLERMVENRRHGLAKEVRIGEYDTFERFD